MLGSVEQSQQKSNENGAQQGETKEQPSELTEANKDGTDETPDSTENTGKTQTTQLTPEQIAEKEQQQKIKQLLRKVDDDPSVLLRNKMILESKVITSPKGKYINRITWIKNPNGTVTVIWDYVSTEGNIIQQAFKGIY